VKIVLIHGFNVRDGGARSIDKLAPLLEAAGHTVDKDEADYGWLGLLSVRIRKYSAVRRIMLALEYADVVISHSNGANYENMALKLLDQRHSRKYKVIRISPALNPKTGVPRNVLFAGVWHTRADWIAGLSGLLLFHPWGRQGMSGYDGTDWRIRNFDYTDLIAGHSDWFENGNVSIIAQDILQFIER
jgi:hypothetical protein